MSLVKRTTLLALALCVTIAGTSLAFGPGGAPAGQPAAGASQPATFPTTKGKIRETTVGGGYTYVLLEHAGGKTWFAMPEQPMKVGQEVELVGGMVMEKFQSSTLNRSFDKVVFSTGPVGGGSNPHAALGEKSPGSAGAAAKSEKVSVTKAAGANSYSVAELYAKAGKLKGKKVTLRAKVVKVTPGIMGRTWVHLQDGTGSAKQGTNNLVATSSEQPPVGSVLTVNGVLAKDKDFGAGYRYKVLLEKATFKP